MTGIGNTAVIPVNPWQRAPEEIVSGQPKTSRSSWAKCLSGATRSSPQPQLQANSSGVKFLRAGDGAGQTLTINQRNCQDYPLELSFIHQGITFYQLKSAAAVAALGWGADA